MSTGCEFISLPGPQGGSPSQQPSFCLVQPSFLSHTLALILALDLSRRSQASDWTEAPASLSSPKGGHRGACCPLGWGREATVGKRKDHTLGTNYIHGGDPMSRLQLAAFPGTPSSRFWGAWAHTTPPTTTAVRIQVRRVRDRKANVHYRPGRVATPRDFPSRLTHLLGVPLSPARNCIMGPASKTGWPMDLQGTPASALHQPAVTAPSLGLCGIEQHQTGSRSGVQESDE